MRALYWLFADRRNLVSHTGGMEDRPMTVARSQLVDVEVTSAYHYVSRCVPRVFLFGDRFEFRKQWIEDRLEALAQCFAVSIGGFAIMNNHLHLLLRLDPQAVDAWSAEEVIRRSIIAYRPKTLRGEEIEINQAWIVWTIS